MSGDTSDNAGNDGWTYRRVFDDMFTTAWVWLHFFFALAMLTLYLYRRHLRNAADSSSGRSRAASASTFESSWGSRNISSSISIAVGGINCDKYCSAKCVYQILEVLGMSQDLCNIVQTTLILYTITIAIDVVSWTYFIITLKWDRFVVTVDATFSLFGLFSEILMQLFFILRLHFSLRKSAFNRSANDYRLVSTSLVCYFLSGMVAVYSQYALAWRMLSVSTAILTFFCVLTATMTTLWFLDGLKKIANNGDSKTSSKLLSQTARFATLTLVSMTSYVVTKILMIGAFYYCGECKVTFAYYCISTTDKLVSMYCLFASLKIGRDLYSLGCERLHWKLLRVVDTDNITIDTMNTARRKNMFTNQFAQPTFLNVFKGKKNTETDLTNLDNQIKKFEPNSTVTFPTSIPQMTGGETNCESSSNVFKPHRVPSSTVNQSRGTDMDTSVDESEIDLEDEDTFADRTETPSVEEFVEPSVS